MSSADKTPERRRDKRIKASFMVIYKAEDPLRIRMMIGDREVYALMLDLSVGGIAISSDYDIPSGTVLLIRFTIINTAAAFDTDDRAKALSIMGKVCSNVALSGRERRLGICFTKMSDEDKKVISEFVKSIE